MFYIYTQSLQNSESTLACNRRSLFDFGPSFAPAVSNFPECDLTGRCCLNDLKGLFRPLFPGLEDLDWRSFGFLDGEVSDLLWGPVICFLLLDLLLCWVFAAIGGPLRSLLVPSVECIMWVLILSPLGFCEGFWKLKPCVVSGRDGNGQGDPTEMGRQSGQHNFQPRVWVSPGPWWKFWISMNKNTWFYYSSSFREIICYRMGN